MKEENKEEQNTIEMKKIQKIITGVKEKEIEKKVENGI